MFESCSLPKFLCKADRQRLDALTPALAAGGPRIENAVARLKQAQVVENDLYPHNTARIGAVVSLRDLGTGSVARFKLVEAVSMTAASAPVTELSVISALGLELLGMRVGAYLKWILPNGHQRDLRLEEVSTGGGDDQVRQVVAKAS